MIIMAGLFLAVFHTQLLNGFRIINNKMALALNQSMDLGFYYYVSVQMENSRRDSVLAVVFFLLIAGILLSFLRKYPLILFVLTGVMECFVLIVAPYSISAVFFLFLGSWIVYFSLRKGKKEFAGLIGILCILMIFPLYFHDQTTVPADTMIKRSILVQIRKMTQGESYVAEGGLGNGDIASVGEVSPTGEKLFKDRYDLGDNNGGLLHELYRYNKIGLLLNMVPEEVKGMVPMSPPPVTYETIKDLNEEYPVEGGKYIQIEECDHIAFRYNPQEEIYSLRAAACLFKKIYDEYRYVSLFRVEYADALCFAKKIIKFKLMNVNGESEETYTWQLNDKRMESLLEELRAETTKGEEEKPKILGRHFGICPRKKNQKQQGTQRLLTLTGFHM